MLLSRRMGGLCSRLPPLELMCYLKLSDSAVMLALNRSDSKKQNSRKKTRTNLSQNETSSPKGYDFYCRRENVNKKGEEKRVWSKKTATPNRNNPELSSTEDESDYEDLAKLEHPDWEKIPKIKINKNFYTPSKWTSDRTDDCINNFRKANGISLELCRNTREKRDHKYVLKPIFEFKELDFNVGHQLTSCTPIQSYAIPTILSGTNLVGVASDG